MMKHILLFIILSNLLLADFEGLILSENNEPVIGATILVLSSQKGTFANNKGEFLLLSEEDSLEVRISSIAYRDTILTIYKDVFTEVILKNANILGNELVVTGTRTNLRRTENPIIVGVISNSTIERIQACSVADALSFQAGLRLETDCQTCNYTQLRMNGLGGAYSQILINGRPVFSPLTGLYGLEQIPGNMIEQIEVVRGGGSAMYGSSAIGGTVNIITALPRNNNYNLEVSNNIINGQANDNLVSGDVSLVSNNGNAGVTLFFNHRNREAYEHNGDNYSELPELRNTSFGAKAEYNPNTSHKLEFNFAALNEYRYGGEIVNRPAHLAIQSEERTHDVLMAGLDYSFDLNLNSSLLFYLSGQRTNREHFTGVQPEDPLELENYLSAPPYGDSRNSTYQVGAKFDHRFNDNLFQKNHLTIGVEFNDDDIIDRIDTYNYLIDQRTQNLGVYAQSDIQITERIEILTGLRFDDHNFLDNPIFSPRLSALYKLGENTQFRATWGRGFRAPQAFNADMHIAFAGGGVSRIQIANDLQAERSDSYSLSLNYDKASSSKIYGFTLEAFHTNLQRAFYLQPTGEDQFGETFEKRNGPGASVSGITFELRANYKEKIQIESGFTIQQSLFSEAVENIEGLDPSREFLRTPNDYGFLTVAYMPNEKLDISMNSVYTGSMLITHFAGAPEQSIDENKQTNRFLEIGLRAAYRLDIPALNSGITLISGVRNLTNSYQNDFDTFQNRDSNYIYGPSRPRTIYFGVGFGS